MPQARRGAEPPAHWPSGFLKQHLHRLWATLHRAFDGTNPAMK